MRIALFGAGRVGRLHAENIANHPTAELGYVYDVKQSAARAVVGAAGGVVATSPEQICDDPDTDAVLIASSTDTHAGLLDLASRAGKAVYCEKPIDLDMSKVSEVVGQVRATGVPVFMGFRRRYIAGLRSIHDGIHDGSLGRVEALQILSREVSPPPIDYVEASGGMLRDKVIHSFDLACWLTGEFPVEVHAAGSCLVDPAIGEAGDVDTVAVTLRMASGALCQIASGRRSVYGYDERVEVYGERGLLQWHGLAQGSVARFTEGGVAMTPPAPEPGYFRQESFAAALGDFIDSVESGRLVSPSLEDGLRAQLIAEAASESLATRRPVALSEPLLT